MRKSKKKINYLKQEREARRRKAEKKATKKRKHEEKTQEKWDYDDALEVDRKLARYEWEEGGIYDMSGKASDYSPSMNDEMIEKFGKLKPPQKNHFPFDDPNSD